MEVGQKIYLKPIGNAARRSTDIIETTVTKVGRKYFEVEYRPCNRLSIEYLAEDNGQYISNYQGYLSMQEIEDEREAYQLHRLIKQNLGVNKPRHSLATLKKIAEVMDIKTDQQCQ
jgi:hypothetical protein